MASPIEPVVETKAQRRRQAVGHLVTLAILVALAVVASDHEVLSAMLCGAAVVPLSGLIRLARNRPPH